MTYNPDNRAFGNTATKNRIETELTAGFNTSSRASDANTVYCIVIDSTLFMSKAAVACLLVRILVFKKFETVAFLSFLSYTLTHTPFCAKHLERLNLRVYSAASLATLDSSHTHRPPQPIPFTHSGLSAGLDPRVWVKEGSSRAAIRTGMLKLEFPQL